MPDFEPLWHRGQLETSERKCRRRLSLSEILTIVIAFHSSHYRNFKHYYWMLLADHRAEFPNLASYSRFVELMPTVLGPLCAYLEYRYGACTGVSFVDSTAIAVCGNKRIARHRVFAGLAQRGKTTMGWFYGFKLHLVINEVGELLACQFTAGNVDNRQPVPQLAERLSGKLFGDKGYILPSFGSKVCNW